MVFREIFPDKVKNPEIFLNNLKKKKGLEIGGPSNIFRKRGALPVYPVIEDLDGCNFSDQTVWEGAIREGHTYTFDKKRKPGYQFISDAVDLNKISSATYDFVISSHAIEHIANPLLALNEWLRIIKNTGILLVVAPHKDGTFDHNRPLTDFNHLLDDFRNQTKEDDLSHLPEILRLHDLSLDPMAGNFEMFKKRSLDNYRIRCLHHHVFNTKRLLQIFDHCRLQILAAHALKPYHIIVMGRKIKKTETLNNEPFLRDDATCLVNSPFVSDKTL